MSEETLCPICGQTPSAPLAIFVDTKPSFDRVHRTEIDGFSLINKEEILLTGICGNTDCLKSLIESLLAGSVPPFLMPTNAVPGGWFGPGGCPEYLKGVFRSKHNVLDWYDYAYAEKAVEEEKTRLSRIFDRVGEAKPASFSIVGAYGSLMDGCTHFCSPKCAMDLLFGDPNSDEFFFANILSHAGMPNFSAQLTPRS